MLGKKQSEKQKSKVRITEVQTSDELQRSAADRLAELEAELEVDHTGKATPAPLADLDPFAGKQTAETLFATHGARKKLALFWGVLILSLIISKLPGANVFFTPLTQFATMVHEMSHAIMCVLTGGHVSGMTIVSDGAGHGGLTMSQGGVPFLHVQAGYMGTAIFGCLLVYLSQFHKLSRGILIGIGSLIGLASVFFIAPTLLSPHFVQALFSLLWAVAMAGVTIYAGMKLKDSNANLVLLFLAIFTAMDSLNAINIVVSATLFGSTVWSDATVMEHLFILPAMFWAFLWAALSVVMLGTTVWFTYGPGHNQTRAIGGSLKSALVKRKKQ